MPVAVESKSPAPIEDKKESIPVAKRPRGRPRKNIIDSPISKALVLVKQNNYIFINVIGRF